MSRRFKSGSRGGAGFTLLEMLIVVAIISILVSVSIPVFSSQAQKAKEATCAANRRSLKAVLATEYLLDGGGSAAADGTHQLTDAQKEEFPCPEGGTITYRIDGKENTIRVYCSVHEKTGSIGDAQSMQTMVDILSKLGTIDSTATTGNNTAYLKAVEQFKAAGIDLGEFKTWRYQQSGGGSYLLLSMEEIPQDRSTSLYYIQYNVKSGNYTVWKGSTSKMDGSHNKDAPYYVLGGQTGKPLNPDVADQSYEKAVEVYRKAIA